MLGLLRRWAGDPRERSTSSRHPPPGTDGGLEMLRAALRSEASFSLTSAEVERLWRDAKLLEIGGGTLEAHQKNLTKDLIASRR